MVGGSHEASELLATHLNQAFMVATFKADFVLAGQALVQNHIGEKSAIET